MLRQHRLPGDPYPAPVDPAEDREPVEGFADLAALDRATIEDLERARSVALEHVLRPDYLSDPAVLSEHPGIADVLDLGIEAKAALVPLVNVLLMVHPNAEKEFDEDILG